MHLIAHQASIAGSSTHIDPSISTPTFDHVVYRMKTMMQNYIQPSCCPNVFQFTRDGKNVWYSAKPIKAGEKLFMAPIPISDAMSAGKVVLWKQLESKCKCPRCKGKTLSQVQREQLTSDPAYGFIQSNKRTIGIGQIEPLMDACVTVLRRFGEINWCDELRHIISIFQDFQYYTMASGVAAFQHPFIFAVFLKNKRRYAPEI